MSYISRSAFPALRLVDEPSRLRALLGVNWALALAALALSVVGAATVHSASKEMVVDYFPRQVVFIGVGLLIGAFAFSLHYRLVLALSIPAYAIALLGLLLVLLAGHKAGGQQNWFRIAGFGLQPSEFAKIATVLLLARYLASIGERFLGLREISIALAIVGVPMSLTLLEPDLGGAMMFAPILVGMLLVAGVRLRVILFAVLAAGLVATLAWSFALKTYQKERVMTFLDSERDPTGAGYQARQSKIAVGSGALAGKGYMQGSQSQLRFLPARHTDFIFAVLAEEWGFLGVASVLLLFAAYLGTGATIAMRAADRASIFLAVGLLSVFAFHTLYNSAMVIGLVPITGIPLPFVSYGGSSMLINWATTGLLLGIDYRRYANR